MRPKNAPQNMKSILPNYSLNAVIQTSPCSYFHSVSNTQMDVACDDSHVDLSWGVSTCDDWKNGFDHTIGGLFPNMTTAFFIDEMLEDGCPCEFNFEGCHD